MIFIFIRKDIEMESHITVRHFYSFSSSMIEHSIRSRALFIHNTTHLLWADTSFIGDPTISGRAKPKHQHCQHHHVVVSQLLLLHLVGFPYGRHCPR